MAKLESIDVWKSRIARGKKFLKKAIKNTNKYVKAYNNEWSPYLAGTAEYSVHNYVHKVVQVAIANLVFRDPEFQLPSHNALEYETNAQGELVLTRIVSETGIAQEMRLATKDGILRGSGYLKIGYHSEVHPSPEEFTDTPDAVKLENETLLQGGQVEAKIDEDHDMHMAMHQAILDDPQTLSIVVGLPNGIDILLNIVSHIEHHRELKERSSKKGRLYFTHEPNNIWVRHLDFRDVIWDSNASRPEDARWVAIRKVVNLRQLKKGGVLRSTRDIEGGDVPSHISPGGGSEGDFGADTAEEIIRIPNFESGSQDTGPNEDDDRFLVEIYEIWDRAMQQVLVISPQSDKYLRREESPYKGLPGFWPIVQLQFNHPAGVEPEEEPMRCYGTSWIEPWWNEQQQLNLFLTLRTAIARHQVPRYVLASGVSNNFGAKLARAQVGAFTRLDGSNPNLSPQDAVSPVQHASTSFDIQAIIQDLRDTISFSSGFTELQLVGVSTARTATAAALQNQAQTAFADMLLSQIERTYERAAKIILAIAKQYFTPDRILTVEGSEQAALEWGAFLNTPAGQLGLGSSNGAVVEVIPGSTRPQVDALKRQQWLELYQVAMAEPQIDRLKVLKQMLRHMGIRRPEYFITPPQPTPEVINEQFKEQKEQGAAQAPQQQTLGELEGSAVAPPGTIGPRNIQPQRQF